LLGQRRRWVLKALRRLVGHRMIGRRKVGRKLVDHMRVGHMMMTSASQEAHKDYPHRSPVAHTRCLPLYSMLDPLWSKEMGCTLHKS
jgi:hypothetical protein